jgi:hypothetical protein
MSQTLRCRTLHGCWDFLNWKSRLTTHDFHRSCQNCASSFQSFDTPELRGSPSASSLHQSEIHDINYDESRSIQACCPCLGAAAGCLVCILFGSRKTLERLTPIEGPLSMKLLRNRPSSLLSTWDRVSCMMCASGIIASTE